MSRPKLTSKAIGTTLVLGGIVVVPLLIERSTTPITHYAGDDYSLSALSLVDQREAHCKQSISHYKRGDIRKEVPFAELPEFINEQQIDNKFLFNPCTDLSRTDAQIGKNQGTSLIRFFESLEREINNDRLTNPNRKTVVTITLHAVEVMPGQPPLDEAGYEKLRSQLANITANNQGTVAIMGPGGELQEQLKTEIALLPNVKVCPFNATESCIKWAFETVR